MFRCPGSSSIFTSQDQQCVSSSTSVYLEEYIYVCVRVFALMSEETQFQCRKLQSAKKGKKLVKLSGQTYIQQSSLSLVDIPALDYRAQVPQVERKNRGNNRGSTAHKLLFPLPSEQNGTGRECPLPENQENNNRLMGIPRDPLRLLCLYRVSGSSTRGSSSRLGSRSTGDPRPETRGTRGGRRPKLEPQESLQVPGVQRPLVGLGKEDGLPPPGGGGGVGRGTSGPGRAFARIRGQATG